MTHNVRKTEHYAGCRILFGSPRFAVRMTQKRLTNPCTKRQLFIMYLAKNVTRRVTPRKHDQSSQQRRDGTRPERSKWIRLWRNINGASVQLRTTQAVRFGSVRFCSAGLGLQCEWRITRLANPSTERHIFNIISQTTRRDEIDRTKICSVFTTTATREDGVDSSAEWSKWIRLSGYVKRYKPSAHWLNIYLMLIG